MSNFEDSSNDYSDFSFEQMISVLYPKYKSIIVLRFFEGMPLDDIAHILDKI